jgi:hypothetical protein
VIAHPTLRFDNDPSLGGSGSVSVCGLDQDTVALCSEAGDLLKSIFRVTVVRSPSSEENNLPNVSGRYFVLEDELQFIPHFPFEKGLKYRAIFDVRQLGVSLQADPMILDFEIPAEENAPEPTEVTRIFPSADFLPENLLRFYVCFSNTMERGHALEQISLLDSHGRPVPDALYRPPLELWDRTMRHLTVLLDPGRLKRWVGPNVVLGPPLKIGEEYSLEIGTGMLDVYGRPLRQRYSKRFLVGNAVRERVSTEHWKILRPSSGSRQPLTLIFANPLDWALLLRTITICSAHGQVVDGQVVIDESEKRWSFTPSAPWVPGVYSIRVGSGLEDVSGNSITGAFDRSLRDDSSAATGKTDSFSLSFQLM